MAAATAVVPDSAGFVARARFAEGTAATPAKGATAATGAAALGARFGLGAGLLSVTEVSLA
jgi:hypothetical protein